MSKNVNNDVSRQRFAYICAAPQKLATKVKLGLRLKLQSPVRKWKALDNIDLNLVCHRYVSGALKDDHFVSARSLLASDPSPRGLF